jgi:hypothetical protein
LFATILALHAPSLHQIVQHYFGQAGPAAVRRADCIVGRESNWKPWAVNSSSGATGLFQILPSAHPQFNRALLLNPSYNTWAAWQLSRHGRDWSPWNGGRWPC